MKKRNISKTPKAAKRQQKPRPAVTPEAHAKAVRARMIFLGCVLVAAMAAALTRSATLQTDMKDRLNHEARRNYVRSEPLETRRGDITDRNGNLLATTVHRWAVTTDPRFVVDKAETARILGGLIGVDESKIMRRLSSDHGPEELTHVATNKAIEAAKRLTQPYADAVSDVMGVASANLDRSVKLMTYFYQMEQLQTPAIRRVVKVLDDTAETVSAVLHADSKQMNLFNARGRKFAYLARHLDDVAANRLSDARKALGEHCTKERKAGRECVNPLSRIRLRPEPRRYYPKREVAAQLIGLVDRQNSGSGGLERMLNGFLGSTPHLLTRVRDRRGRSMYLNGLDPTHALQPYSAQLTIDEKIQAYAEQVIQETCLVSGSRAGYAVVMDIKTGEVLAAANYPAYNPNDYNKWHRSRQPIRDERDAFGQAFDAMEWAATSPMLSAAYPGKFERFRRESARALQLEKNAFIEYEHAYPNASRSNAFQELYEPGSVTKVFTVAAALEEKILDLDDVFVLESGLWSLNDPEDTKIRDTSPLKEGDVGLIIKKSSNIGAGKIGLSLTSERLERFFRAFGFGAKSGSGFPGEASGLFRPSERWTDVDLVNISFGQGFSVTGVQLAAAVAALGNGGRLMRPRLVKHIYDENGEVIQSFGPEVVTQVVSEKTARTVIDLMRKVVEPGGTGVKAYLPEYPVAGKTGTGQKSHLKKRGYADDMWVNTFIGVAPAGNPALAVVVLIDEPKGKRHGGGIFAAPAFRRIMRWTLKYLGVPSPYEAGKQVAWVDPHELSQRRASDPASTQGASSLSKHAPPVSTADAGSVAVPTFADLTMDQVRRLAQASSIRVTYHGTGIARSQDTPAHSRVPAWTGVHVFFHPRGRPNQAREYSAQDASLTPFAGGRTP